MTTAAYIAGQEVRMPAGRAIITRVENGRVYFRYIRNGKPSKAERNIPLPR